MYFFKSDKQQTLYKYNAILLAVAMIYLSSYYFISKIINESGLDYAKLFNWCSCTYYSINVMYIIIERLAAWK